ncbi:MAG: pyridoxamine 5'-phosphate oxidase family protein [Oscillospiraceae bacterium]|nr:pyridoxamine 5'-phosphate oxidase family protein [Oscillospiraceae bacterium]
MFRDMRRSAQALPEEMCRDILARGTSGVLAVSGDDGYPYAVPLSYVLDGDRLLFHCAAAGHKLDALARSDKASFCVIGSDEVLPDLFTTAYRSAIVFGRLRILSEECEKRAALGLFIEKYSPAAAPDARRREIDGALARVCILELRAEHVSGKEAIELVRRRAR